MFSKRNRTIKHQIFLIISTFILLEFLLRLIYPHGSLSNIIKLTNDEQIFTLKENSKLNFYGVYDKFKNPVLYLINSQGLREDNFISDFPKNRKIRVATFGDSETFGWSVNSSETFQKQMEKLNNNLEVINFGVPGYSIYNITFHIQKNITKFKSNYVIYVINPNDFELSYPKILLNYLKFTQSNSYVITRLNLILMRDFIYLYNTFNNKNKISEFYNNLLSIKNYCEKNNSILILLFMDWKNYEDLKLKYSYSFSSNFICYDSSNIFDKNSKIDGHLNIKGHKLLAIFLNKIIENYSLSKSKVDMMTQFFTDTKNVGVQ